MTDLTSVADVENFIKSNNRAIICIVCPNAKSCINIKSQMAELITATPCGFVDSMLEEDIAILPTFKVYNEGKLVETIEGLNLEALKQHVEVERGSEYQEILKYLKQIDTRLARLERSRN